MFLSGRVTVLTLILNLLENLQQDLKMVVYQWSITILKRIMGNCCTIQVWKALRDVPRNLITVITAKAASTKYWLRGVNIYVN